MARYIAPDPSERVRAYLLFGRDAEALAACSGASPTNPTDPGLLTLSSVAAPRLGRQGDAVQSGTKAVAAGPGSDGGLPVGKCRAILNRGIREIPFRA